MKKLLCITAFLAVGFCYSQSKTKYELKKEQLVTELFKNLGIGEYEISLMKNEKDEAKKTNMFFSRLKSIPNSYENQQLIQQYYQDMQKANALKTKVDFDREEEKERKRNEEKLVFEQEQEKKKLELQEQKEVERKELIRQKTEIAKEHFSKGNEYFESKNFEMAIASYENARNIFQEIHENNAELNEKLNLAIQAKKNEEDLKAAEEKKQSEKKQRNQELLNTGKSLLNSIFKK